MPLVLNVDGLFCKNDVKGIIITSLAMGSSMTIFLIWKKIKRFSSMLRFRSQGKMSSKSHSKKHVWSISRKRVDNSTYFHNSMFGNCLVHSFEVNLKY